MRASQETRKPDPDASRLCGNDGCFREPHPGERLCEECSLEFSLFRRDERSGKFPATR
jgi:hypothetical protein